MSPFTLFAVGIGGAIGALCRSKATAFLKKRFATNFPTATLCINVVACLIAGIALCFQTTIGQVAYLALTMGFLGGFSTMSTMNYEAVELIMGGKAKTGVAYLAATYASTIGAAAIGFAIASLLL